MDPQSLFINPAILPYRNLAFSLGMKIYHVGFLSDNSTGLKYSYSSNSIPNVLLNGAGLGITLQSFDTPILNNAGIGLSLGYAIIPGVAIGVSAHGNNLNYDRSKFDLKDAFDPVFQNGTGQWNVSFGAGLFVHPNERFSFGLSANNINRPDLSLQNKGARIPVELDFGLKYFFSNIFGVSLFSHYQEEELTPGIIAEANFSHKGLIKTGYTDRCVMVEGNISLTNGFALNYRMDYPLYEVNKFSYGSHQLGFSWNMKLRPDSPLNIHASADTVKVIKECTKLRLKKADQDKLLSNLDYPDLYYPEKKATEEIVQEPGGGIPLDDIEDVLPHNKYLEEYRESFNEIRKNLKETNRKINIDIYYSNGTTAERAKIIKNYLVDSLHFKRDEIRLLQEKKDNQILKWQQSKKDSIQKLINNSRDRNSAAEFIEISSPYVEKLLPEKVKFSIPGLKSRKISDWRILITNYAKQTVHEIKGHYNIGDPIEWDGLTGDGVTKDKKLLAVGNYYYQFQYSTNGGVRWIPDNPKRQPIVFIRVKREKTVEITTENVNDLKLLKEIVIRLKEPPDQENMEQ